MLSSQAQKRHQLPKPLGRDAYKYVSTPRRPVKQPHDAADEKIDYVAQPPPQEHLVLRTGQANGTE